MSENEKKVRNDYAEFLAKQEARKTASHDRITAKMKTIDKDISAKYIPNNLKIIAGLTVGQVQQVSDASDVPVDVEAGKMPPFYLYPPRINAIQVVTTPDDVAYILVKGDEDTEDKYVLTDNFDVYNKLGEPNKLIVVTKKDNIPIVGLPVIAMQNDPVQFISDAKDAEKAPMKLWAEVNNAIQVVTTPDDVAYILVKGEDGEEDKYVLTDNFDVYNKLGEPNKLIVVTTPNDVLNVPVVEEESSASSETSDSSISSSSEESSSESSEESSSSSEESSSESSEESSSSSEESSSSSEESSSSSEESSSSSEEAPVGPSESSSASSEESTSSASE